MKECVKPCSTCLIENCLISKVEDDPRDEITNNVRTFYFLIIIIGLIIDDI